MENQKSILIIDDELEEREEYYNKMLESSFNLEFIRNIDDIMNIKSFNVDGYILDVNLEEWQKYSEKILDEIYEKLNSKVPIFLISKQWNSSITSSASMIIKNSGYNRVVQFIPWEQFIATSSEFDYNNISAALCYQIKRDILQWNNQTELQIKENETISILHISDLQFGDPDFDDSSLFFDDVIPDYLLNDKDINPHLLVITGDISYSGKANEFLVAKEKISNLCKNLWKEGSLQHERILLVPGNHDVNLDSCASKSYQYDFKTGEHLLRENTNIDIPSYSKQQFKEFAYSLTKNDLWLKPANDCTLLNERYIEWGIRFFQLSSVNELNQINNSKASFQKKTMDNIIKQTSTSNKKIYNIILAHHGPRSIGYESDNSDNWDKFRPFIEQVKANMYLYGHFHKSKIAELNDNGGKYSFRLVESLASTLCLNKKVRVGDSRRGFNIVELERKLGIVKKVRIRTFEINEARIHEITEDGDPKRYCWKTIL